MRMMSLPEYTQMSDAELVKHVDIS